MTALEELQEAAAAVRGRLGPATVAIGRDERGSGIVIAPGQVLTCAHNLRNHTTQVTFADGRAVQSAVRGADTDGDLVVLEVDTGDTSPITWSDPVPQAGQIVF